MTWFVLFCLVHGRCPINEWRTWWYIQINIYVLSWEIHIKIFPVKFAIWYLNYTVLRTPSFWPDYVTPYSWSLSYTDFQIISIISHLAPDSVHYSLSSALLLSRWFQSVCGCVCVWNLSYTCPLSFLNSVPTMVLSTCHLITFSYLQCFVLP